MLFISCSMTCFARCSITAMNLGPPGDRKRDANTLGADLLPSSCQGGEEHMTTRSTTDRTINPQFSSHHDVLQPGQGDLPELCVGFPVEDRPAVPAQQTPTVS